jgi:hypothetical protein
VAISDDDKEELDRMMLPLNGVNPSPELVSVLNLLRAHKIGVSDSQTKRISEFLVHYSCATELDCVIIPGNKMGLVESSFKITHANSMLFETELNADGQEIGFPMGEYVDANKLSFQRTKDWVEMFLAKPENIMHVNNNPSCQIVVDPNFGKNYNDPYYPSTLIVWGLESGFIRPLEVSDRCTLLIELEGFNRVEKGDLYLFSKLSFCQAGALKQLKYLGVTEYGSDSLKSQLMELLSEELGELPEPVTDEELEGMKDELDDDNEQLNKDTRRGMLAYLHFSLE